MILAVDSSAALAAQADCCGPEEAWLLPRLLMRFESAGEAVDGPVAKLGGQPHWLDGPAWPVSGSTGAPMTFVGQFPVPGGPERVAYLFVSDEGGIHDPFPATYEPEAAENALLVQPGGRVPAWLAVTGAATGPSLWRRGEAWDERVPVELAVGFDAPEDGAAGGEPWDSYAGGTVSRWQRVPLPVGPDWRFFFQLSGGEGYGSDDAYKLNFGGGTGYAFLSPDGLEGRFFWDR
jgi:hypothetical protein